MLCGKLLLQAIQAHDLPSINDFVLQYPQLDEQTGVDRLDMLCKYKAVYGLHASAKKAGGRVSRLFGRSYFLWSRCWPQIRANTILLIQTVANIDEADVNIILNVYERTINTSTDDQIQNKEMTELIWAVDFTEALRSKQRQRSQVVAGRLVDKAYNEDVYEEEH